MYYNYDEYMREVLGYPNTNSEDREESYEDFFQAPTTYRQEYPMNQTMDLANCYPDIYKMLMPMVQKACENLYEPITENDISKVALDIYFQFESDERPNNRNTNTEEERLSREKNDNISYSRTRRFDRNLEKSITSKPTGKEEVQKEENRNEERNTTMRKPQNSLLFDLIRILVLNRILGRPNFPPRPQRPRPPMLRPPIRPRDEYYGYDGNRNDTYWQY